MRRGIGVRTVRRRRIADIADNHVAVFIDRDEDAPPRAFAPGRQPRKVPPQPRPAEGPYMGKEGAIGRVHAGECGMVGRPVGYLASVILPDGEAIRGPLSGIRHSSARRFVQRLRAARHRTRRPRRSELGPQTAIAAGGDA